MTFAPEHIDPATWPAVYAILAPGIARGDYTARELVDELIDNTAQLWVMRKGGDPIAAAVSELVSTPVGPVVHGRLCAGRGMAGWVDDLIDCIRAHAEHVGAVEITVDGRAGWERVLSGRGWHRKSITMALPLKAKVSA